MQQFIINPIGIIAVDGDKTAVEVNREYRPALQALEGFSHLQVLWWLDGCDTQASRQVLEALAPYRQAPDRMGIFATRSPVRPNPIALTTAQVIRIDHVQGRIELAYIDGRDGSPVIDLKPYTPSLDRVENPRVPSWCCHWPKSLEESAFFDWQSEFRF